MPELKHQIPPLMLTLRMARWGISLRLLRRFVPVRRLVRLAVPEQTGTRYTVKEVLRVVQLIDAARLWSRNGDCLVRALVCHRFLLLCGAQPTLVIGFNSEQGHSWVELAGKPVLEAEASLLHRPMLIVPPGSRDLVIL